MSFNQPEADFGGLQDMSKFNTQIFGELKEV